MNAITFQKISRILSGFFKLGSILMGVCAVLLTAGILVFVCSPFLTSQREFQEAWNTAAASGMTLSYMECILFFLSVLVMFICLFFILFRAKQLFRCIGKGSSPFTAWTSSRIRRIAFWAVVYSLIPMLPFYSFHLSSFLWGVLFALILYCVSLIFDYGCSLQKEVDETL